MSDFWEGKKPCWDIVDCPQYIRKKCPAHHYPERPCWENAYTQTEALTGIKKDCTYCKIFKLYHHSES